MRRFLTSLVRQGEQSMDPLANLKIFMQVADNKSFSRAAEVLRLPRATVSGAIQALETRVGSRLLQRTTRTVQLSPDGMAFYQRCCDVLADFDDLDTMFQAGGGANGWANPFRRAHRRGAFGDGTFARVSAADAAR